MDARFNGVGLFTNISACMATDIWTETEVLKEMEDRFKTVTHLQSVMVKKTFQGLLLRQLSASRDIWQEKDD